MCAGAIIDVNQSLELPLLHKTRQKKAIIIDGF